MLTRLALMFIVHVMVLGVIFGRRMEFVRMSRLAWVFAYLVFFYISWGLIFSLLPELIEPELLLP
jgi:hypothetical protein